MNRVENRLPSAEAVQIVVMVVMTIAFTLGAMVMA